MKKYYKIFTLLTLLVLFNCEQDDNSSLSNFVGFEQGPVYYTIDEDQTRTIDVTVAASEVSSSDRTYSIMVDNASTTFGSPYTVPGTVTIPGGSNLGTFTVSATDDANLRFAPQDIVIMFEDEAGVDFSNPVTISLTQTCVNTVVNLNLTFDAYAEEAVWELYDLNGTPTIIESGGSGGEYDALDGEDISIGFCLESGSYGIVVYDYYGDGGTDYSITLEDGTELASGSTPDAGGGYPLITDDTSTFTID